MKFMSYDYACHEFRIYGKRFTILKWIWLSRRYQEKESEQEIVYYQVAHSKIVLANQDSTQLTPT
jgi:hypothetical protein